jgi:serine phosphatase RsbU (regulator of sigma subunit)
MEIKIAIAKINKYGEANSGDTVEIIERPNGGFSAVMADGQIKGKKQKSISTLVAHRVIEHISNGIRDGAAIRTASNTILADYQGAVAADLHVVSVDLQTNTIIISRNNPLPVFLINEDTVDCLSTDSEPIGTRTDIRASIVELEMKPDMTIIAFTDGVANAGKHNPPNLDICEIVESILEEQESSAQEIADFLINRSIRLDDGRPKDDMSVFVLQVLPQSKDRIRRMNVSFTPDEEA